MPLGDIPERMKAYLSYFIGQYCILNKHFISISSVFMAVMFTLPFFLHFTGDATGCCRLVTTYFNMFTLNKTTLSSES